MAGEILVVHRLPVAGITARKLVRPRVSHQPDHVLDAVVIRHKLVGQGFDNGAQFEMGKPTRRDRLDSGGCAEKIAGDRAGRVTVPTVIHRENDGVFEIPGTECAINSHRQSFFGDESFSKFAQRGAFVGTRVRQAFGFLDGRQSFLVGRMLAVLFFCRVNSVDEGYTVKNQADHDGKRPRTEESAGMSMGDRGEISAGCKNVRRHAAGSMFAAQGMREVHAYGGYTHHSAAAFAVVGGPRHFAPAGLQRGETSGSRSAAAE